MDTLSYKTVFVNKATVSRKWYLIDAEGEVLGRLSSKVAKIIMGKSKPDYTPHFNSGDKVIIINAEKVRLTGKKMTDKRYVRYTGYPGGQKFRSPLNILHRKPEDLILHAVKGMLPKNKLQKHYLKNLHVYVGQQHPHQAQNPVKIEL